MNLPHYVMGLVPTGLDPVYKCSHKLAIFNRFSFAK